MILPCHAMLRDCGTLEQLKHFYIKIFGKTDRTNHGTTVIHLPWSYYGKITMVKLPWSYYVTIVGGTAVSYGNGRSTYSKTMIILS